MAELTLPMRLLGLLSYGGIRSTNELARSLGVSEALVGMMAEDLTRRGYLQALGGGDCSTGCGGCAVVSQCKLPGAEDRLPLLALTEKGRLMCAVHWDRFSWLTRSPRSETSNHRT